MWFNRHPLNNSLVVFVHGIFGDSWGTWLGVPGIIQSMAEHDPWVRSYDFYSFQYDSTAFHQPPLIPFAVDGLRQFLNRIQRKYGTVVIVAHSQGGLLSKAFILQELLAGNGGSLKVDLLITLGTPHAGRKALNPLHWMRKVPGLKRLGQLAQLASRSETIRFIRDNWNDQHIVRRPGNPRASGATFDPWRWWARTMCGLEVRDRKDTLWMCGTIWKRVIRPWRASFGRRSLE